MEVLRSKRGYHTELISLYIPPSRPLSAVIGYLRNEISESSNIKSKPTRKNVTNAITSLIETLKSFRSEKPSETGLVLFDGFIPVYGPGTEKEEHYLLIPPEPVNAFRYHCASEFLLGPLEDMLKDKTTIGLVSIERNESAVCTLRGKHLEVIDTMFSGIHGKHMAGGQSQHRFERLFEEHSREFYKRTGEHANTIFLEQSELEYIVIGGPGLTKQEFLDGPFLRDEFKKKVLLPLVDTDGGGANGVRLLVHKAQDMLKETEFIKEKLLVDKFMGHIARDSGMTVYGLRETMDALKNAAVERLLVSEHLDRVFISRTCSGCGETSEFILRTSEAKEKIATLNQGECPACKSGYVNAKVQSVDLIEKLGEIASQSGTEVKVVSTDAEDGKMFLQTFGGIGGFLRYKYGQ